MLSVAKKLIKKGPYSIHKHEREKNKEKKQFPEKIKVRKPLGLRKEKQEKKNARLYTQDDVKKDVKGLEEIQNMCTEMRLRGGEGDGGIHEKKKYILVSEEEFNALDEIAEQRDDLRNECSIQKLQPLYNKSEEERANVEKHQSLSGNEKQGSTAKHFHFSEAGFACSTAWDVPAEARLGQPKTEQARTPFTRPSHPRSAWQGSQKLWKTIYLTIKKLVSKYIRWRQDIKSDSQKATKIRPAKS